MLHYWKKQLNSPMADMRGNGAQLFRCAVGSITPISFEHPTEVADVLGNHN